MGLVNGVGQTGAETGGQAMKLHWLVVAVALAAFAAGCGETPSVTVYKKGQYQGKPDTQPWSGGQFKV